MDHAIEKILDSTYDAMIAVDANGIITLYNKAAEKLTGQLRGDVIGRSVVDVVPNTRLMHVLSTGAPELNRRQVLGHIEIITSRFPLKEEDAIIGAVAIFRDVTDVVSLAEEVTNLKEIQMTLEAVFNATQDAISVVNQEGIHILINPAYTQITGYTAEEVVGKDYMIDLDEGESVHKKVLMSGQPVENVIVRTGKTKKDIITRAAPILVDGEIKGSVAVIHDITELKRLNKELAQAKQIIRNLEAKYTFDDIKGESLKLKDAMEKAKIAALTPATVILRGESGTGKELFAHAIHNASNRKYAQFVRVNCAAISEGILESELFGYEEGAFTGASKGGRVGLFERASGGTIFLDEIGEISISTQVKLLRVLQEKEIVRVGASKAISVDVRIISATNVDLERAVKIGTFREDLYYRLNVIPIVIPPLRDRLGDLKDLVEAIVVRFNQEYGRNILKVNPQVIDMLGVYTWPGNIRELENYIGRTMIQMKITDTEILPEHLPAFSDRKRAPNYDRPLATSDEVTMPLSHYMDAVESHYIEQALVKNKGNRTETSKQLGVSIRNLYYKMQKYHLE